MAFQWEKKEIRTDKGEQQIAIAPLIISASRATDISAFHTQWFMNRLEKGYIKWINRFNPSKPMYISLENVRLIVFWSKDPFPMIPYLSCLEEKNIHFYFQYTLNNYEKENFEPNLPPLAKRIETFIQLSKRIGKEKIIWRFDPLLLSEELSLQELINRIYQLGNQLVYHTDKLVISFVDIFQYRSVASNLIRSNTHFTRENIQYAEFSENDKIELAENLQRFLKEWKKVNPEFRIATCAETIPLEKYDIEHNKCIDDHLIIRLFPQDQILMDFLGYTPILQNFPGKPARQLKDKNQRALCGCIYSKDIGSYNTCSHHCIYCYANSSIKQVIKNKERLSPDSDTLLP